MILDQQKLEELGVLIHKRFLKWINFRISIL